jgi:hypothetical protein
MPKKPKCCIFLFFLEKRSQCFHSLLIGLFQAELPMAQFSLLETHHYAARYFKMIPYLYLGYFFFGVLFWPFSAHVKVVDGPYLVILLVCAYKVGPGAAAILS